LAHLPNLVRTISGNNVDKWLSQDADKPHVLLFTSKLAPSPLYKSVAQSYQVLTCCFDCRPRQWYCVHVLIRRLLCGFSIAGQSFIWHRQAIAEADDYSICGVPVPCDHP